MDNTRQNLETIKNRRVLITGGAGFIGSHLCEVLLSNGNRVTCLDNFSTGKKENIAPYLSHPNFKLLEGSIEDPVQCERATQGMDTVFHHAAIVSVQKCLEAPELAVRTNIDGFLNILSSAAKAGVRRVVYASSSAVYGDKNPSPNTENQACIPSSAYGLTKLINERDALIYAKLKKIETVGLRYFNVYGTRQNPKGDYAAVIPKFIDATKKGEKVSIFGDGKQTRDFIHVSDVVRANQIAALCSNPDATGKAFNISTGTPVSVEELHAKIQLICKTSGLSRKENKPRNEPAREGEIRHSAGDTSRAQSELNFEASIKLNEGLTELISPALPERKTA